MGGEQPPFPPPSSGAFFRSPLVALFRWPVCGPGLIRVLRSTQRAVEYFFFRLPQKRAFSITSYVSFRKFPKRMRIPFRSFHTVAGTSGKNNPPAPCPWFCNDVNAPLQQSLGGDVRRAFSFWKTVKGGEHLRELPFPAGDPALLSPPTAFKVRTPAADGWRRRCVTDPLFSNPEGLFFALPTLQGLKSLR